MAEDKQEIFFNFSAPFEIHDDNEIMKRMQLHCCHSQPELEQLVPPHLAPFAASWQQHWTAKELPKPEPEPAPEPPGTAAELGTPHAPHAPGFGTCGEPGNVCWREWSAALTAPPVGSGGGRRWMGVVRGTPSGVAPHTTGASGGSQPASLEAAAAAAARAVAARRSTMCAGRGGGLRCFRAATSSGRVNLLPPSPSSVAPCGTPGGGGGSVGGGRWAVRVGA